MKKMNVIPLIVSLFMLFSCTNQEVVELNSVDETATKSYQEEVVYLSAQQLFYAATLEKIDLLETQKAGLIEKKEEGDKDAIKEIEYLQKEINKYKSFSEYFFGMKPPRGPKGPIGPMPPVPCQDEKSNCEPKLKYVKEIVIGENDIEVEVNIIDSKEGIVGKGQIGKGEFGLTVNLEIKPFEGDATMKTFVIIEEIGSIELNIPVRY